MHETELHADSTPAPPPSGRRGVLRFFLAPIGSIRHHPLRFLGFLCFLCLLVLGCATVGLVLWSDSHLRAARRAIDRGHSLAAVRHLRLARTFRPERPEVLLLCAQVARRSGSWTEAEELLDRYWRQRGDDDALVVERLLLRANRGETDTVRSSLQGRLHDNDPSAPLIREALVAGYIHRFRLDDAGRLLEEWLKLQPDNTSALLAQGKLLELRQGTSEALLRYRRVLEIDPSYDDARLRLTNLLIQTKQGEEALAHLEHLRQRLPEHLEVKVQLAQALDLQGRGEEAIDLLEETLRTSPEHSGALTERGRIALAHNDGNRAEECLKLAVQFDPGNLPTRYQYYLALTRNGKVADAAGEKEAIHRLEVDLERISELISRKLAESPDDPGVSHEIAMIALRAGLPKEALRWLQITLQIAPDHLPTHRTLAAFYHESGNPILSARHRAIARQLANPQR